MITQPTTKDIEKLLDLWEMAISENYPLISHEKMSQAENTLREQVQLLPTLHVLKNENGRIVALVKVDEGIIGFLYVHPSERGKGYASKLINHVLEHMEIKGVVLRRTKHDIISFYEKNGFRQENTTKYGRKNYLAYRP
jgi:GNAT superfamily N-acetyltransferase